MKENKAAREAAIEALNASSLVLNKIASSTELHSEIEQAGQLLKTSSNRIIITGIGKSGLIGRKIAATLTSTGSPAVFLHPTDALHGDMGNVQKGEVAIAISNSGETRELLELLPSLRLLGAKVIALTGNKNSSLVKESDAAICYPVEKEGCPLDLAPNGINNSNPGNR